MPYHRKARTASIGFTLAASIAIVVPASAQVVVVYQGADWTAESRETFYTQDQGSRIMPLAWMQALKQPDGEPFLSDRLERYGYLPNSLGAMPDLPVGFTVAEDAGGPSVGMTCSACHARQIDVNGTDYRIDGGPAIVDFQSFLKDLNDAVAAAQATPEAFAAFADAVLGAGAGDAAKEKLRGDLETWHLRFDTLMQRSLPSPGWGPSRLDAVSMIFNRLAGLDLGEPPTYLIPDNIARADAPARYPFLWNAPIQDITQWPGFADNGNDVLGLSRNLGEVYGVFAVFHPVEQSGIFKLNRDYLANNSANFGGLAELEDTIRKLGPPRWPWELDYRLAAQGAAIFNRDIADGGCVACHGIRPGVVRPVFNHTWDTPLVDVGTDSRECEILGRTVQTGAMAGARIPLIGVDIKPTDTAFNLLTASVIGAIVQHTLSLKSGLGATAEPVDEALPLELEALRGAFRNPADLDVTVVESVPDGQPQSGCAYESRVLQGIWAAAPYLHNGSVPSLNELLKPATERVAAFELGPTYDIATVGLAADQTRFDYTLETTDCSTINSGNSRCGHEYGAGLSQTEKAALLEYLKSL
jgi:hypothetical protein